MITFKISFLLSFTLHPQTTQNKKKDKKVKEKPQKKDTKKKKAKPVEEEKESPVWQFGPEELLGVAHVDYDLGPGYYDMVVYHDMMTVPEINFSAGPKRIKSLIEESVFLEHGTTLHLEAYMLAPQTPCLVLHHQRNLFKRILMVINDEQVAKDIFVQIYSHNKRTLDEMKKLSEHNAAVVVEINEVLTGFLIDSGNSYLVFVEGLAKGFFVDVYHLMDKCNLKVQVTHCYEKP
nr:unnamed protein product [Callosobruchus analis]